MAPVRPFPLCIQIIQYYTVESKSIQNQQITKSGFLWVSRVLTQFFLLLHSPFPTGVIRVSSCHFCRSCSKAPLSCKIFFLFWIRPSRPSRLDLFETWTPLNYLNSRIDHDFRSDGLFGVYKSVPMSFLHVFARPIFFEPYPNGWKEISKQTF